MSATHPQPPALTLAASLRLPFIERWLARIDPESVLEVGCGMGAMGYRLASRFEYRGYEPDLASFEVAARRLANLRRGEVHNSELPAVPDRQFDLLVAFEVMEHIAEDAEALRKWTLWVPSNGHVIISVPAHPERFGPMDRKVGHFRRYTRDGLADIFEAAGLEILAIEMWGMPVGYLLEFARNYLACTRLDNAEVGTPGSGRIFQPPAGLGRTVELAMRPLAVLQRPFTGTELGVGFVAVGRVTGVT